VNWKSIIPDPISREIGSFQLPRQTVVQLLAAIHEAIPREYERFRKYRVENNDRLYRFKLLIPAGETIHLFMFSIDDTTANGHLILADITHRSKRYKSD
jgi:hypothetical protein